MGKCILGSGYFFTGKSVWLRGAILCFFVLIFRAEAAEECTISTGAAEASVTEITKEWETVKACNGNEITGARGDKCKDSNDVEALNLQADAYARQKKCLEDFKKLDRKRAKVESEIEQEEAKRRLPAAPGGPKGAAPNIAGADRCKADAKKLKKGDAFKDDFDKRLGERNAGMAKIEADYKAIRKQCGLRESLGKERVPKAKPGDDKPGKDKPGGGKDKPGDDKPGSGMDPGGMDPGGMDGGGSPEGKKGEEKKDGGGGGGSPGGGGGDKPKEKEEPPKPSDVTKKGEDPQTMHSMAGCGHEEKMLNDANQYAAGFRDKFNQAVRKDPICTRSSSCGEAKESVDKAEIKVKEAEQALAQCRDRNKGPSNGKGSESAR